jgi:hypothetical protein
MGRCRRLRGTMRAKPAVVKGAVRVHFGARSDLGSWSRWSRRKVRNSSPDRVGTGRALLDATDVQGGRFELDLLPPQVHKLGRAETCVQCIRRYASPQTQEGR